MEEEGRIGSKGLCYRINPQELIGIETLKLYPHDFTGIEFYRVDSKGGEIANFFILPEEMDEVTKLFKQFKEKYKDLFIIMQSRKH